MRLTKKTDVRHQQGFNLIEIMFALLLLALVITVSVETSSGDVAAYSRMKDSTRARWVAFNQIATVLTSKGFPATGKRDGKEEMGGGNWEWQQEISTTPDPNLRKIKVSVFRAGQEQLPAAVETAYVANPDAKRQTSTPP